ncbi:MAG: excinuclease ABC subunit UvrA [bacterium]
MKNIKVVGARTHNLKNVNIEIPKEKISVMSGISGSGKSSLALDTIYAEGQRRYVENLSSYARQVIGVIEKPDVDSIEGIPPAIAIDQKSIVRSPRSTVGTLTESYDFLRLLFARFGTVKCPKCKKEIFSGKLDEIISSAILSIKQNKGLLKIYATVVKNQKGSHKSALERFANSKFEKVIVDENEYSVKELSSVKLDKTSPHTIEVLVLEKDNFDIKTPSDEREVRLNLEKALEVSDDVIRCERGSKKEIFSKHPYCHNCQIFFPSLQPRLFSFNSPYGACRRCQGLGVVKEVQPELVIPNTRLTLDEGAIRPWSRLAGQNGWFTKSLVELGKKVSFRLDVPIDSLSDEALQAILYGHEDFEGVIPNLEKKYLETDSEYLRVEIEQYMHERVCDRCQGQRLNELALSVYFFDKNIAELSRVEVRELHNYFSSIKDLPKGSEQLILELKRRLNNLVLVGLEYLTLSRSSESLSGGEAQRIRLGVQFDSFLSGVLYVLDEPTIGLHSADTQKIINSFNKLKEEGNTVLIVEHDRSVLEAADFIFDIGPGAGKNGGELVASGTPDEIKKNSKSITGKYLSGKTKISYPKVRRKPSGEIVIKGINHNNLVDLDVKLPLALFIAVCGVSGSGKSSLVYDVLAKALSREYHRSEDEPGSYKEMKGVNNLDKVIKIDQTAIGRTPRSNLATYTGMFTPIRELFADTQEARLKGFNASQFSFNLKGGRCEVCRGDGMIKVEMFFMPDIYVPCEECRGQRYNKETLEIRYRGKTIADVLKSSVEEARSFFVDSEELIAKLSILEKVGLGYLPLGQSATTLSGGEAQRIKLASELSRPSTGKTIYILDEPTTGLHFEDIKKLLQILQELVDRGNTVLIIEHNLDVIKNADWVIDMGPGGGLKGGKIIAEGTPEKIAQNKKSLTGKYIVF